MKRDTKRWTRRSAALTLLAALALPAVAAAQERPERETTTEGKRQHVVRRGDTLWDLARQYFSDPFRWPLIYDANRRVVENPHWIYPLERLIIPGLRTGAARVLGVEFARAMQEQAPELALAEEVVDASVLTELIPEQPVVLPVQFHTAAWLQDTTQLAPIGRVVRVIDPRTEGEQLQRSAFPYERVYVKYAASRPAEGDRLLVVRVSRTIPQWGHVLEPVGVLDVTDLDDEVFTARLIAQYGPVEPAAFVISIDSFPLRPGMESGTITGGPQGMIVGFTDEQLLPGLLDRGFVNLGSADGVGVGDEFEAYLPARRRSSRIGDVKLPEEHIARLRVIRVSARTATFAVTELRHPMLEPGVPVRLVRAVR